VAKVCNYDNYDLVPELRQYGNLTLTYAAMEGLSYDGALAVLSMRNS